MTSSMEHSVFGCKVNKFYLNRRLSYFRQRQFDTANSHLMATCVVTDRAKTKRIKAALNQLTSGKDLFLTWCGAFEKGEAMDYEKFFALYPKLLPYREQVTLLGEDPYIQTDLGQVGEYELNKELSRSTVSPRLTTKKFLVIQSGCDTYCTFCLTIYRRGAHRSRSLEEIIEEVEEFTAAGGQEVVITWVNLAARWASHTRKPSESKFSALLSSLLQKTRIQRIRISSLGPEFLDDQFFDVLTDTRFLPHFHVSIQHFDTQVLQHMNRNYDEQVLRDVLVRLRRLDRFDCDKISIWADLIIWFPGESDEAFQKLLASVEEFRITKVHAFPFSAHQKGESVPAGKLKNQVPTAVKKKRMQQILSLAEQIRSDFKQENRGVTRPVLLEKKRDGWRTWRTPNYLEARLPDAGYSRWQVVEVAYKGDL